MLLVYNVIAICLMTQALGKGHDCEDFLWIVCTLATLLEKGSTIFSLKIILLGLKRTMQSNTVGSIACGSRLQYKEPYIQALNTVVRCMLQCACCVTSRVLSTVHMHTQTIFYTTLFQARINHKYFLWPTAYISYTLSPHKNSFPTIVYIL